MTIQGAAHTISGAYRLRSLRATEDAIALGQRFPFRTDANMELSSIAFGTQFISDPWQDVTNVARNAGAAGDDLFTGSTGWTYPAPPATTATTIQLGNTASYTNNAVPLYIGEFFIVDILTPGTPGTVSFNIVVANSAGGESFTYTFSPHATNPCRFYFAQKVTTNWTGITVTINNIINSTAQFTYLRIGFPRRTYTSSASFRCAVVRESEDRAVLSNTLTPTVGSGSFSFPFPLGSNLYRTDTGYALIHHSGGDFSNWLGDDDFTYYPYSGVFNRLGAMPIDSTSLVHGGFVVEPNIDGYGRYQYRVTTAASATTTFRLSLHRPVPLNTQFRIIFWVKAISDCSGSYTAKFVDAGAIDVATYAFSMTTEWVRHSFTVTATNPLYLGYYAGSSTSQSFRITETGGVTTRPHIYLVAGLMITTDGDLLTYNEGWNGKSLLALPVSTTQEYTDGGFIEQPLEEIVPTTQIYTLTFDVDYTDTLPADEVPSGVLGFQLQGCANAAQIESFLTQLDTLIDTWHAAAPAPLQVRSEWEPGIGVWQDAWLRSGNTLPIPENQPLLWADADGIAGCYVIQSERAMRLEHQAVRGTSLYLSPTVVATPDATSPATIATITFTPVMEAKIITTILWEVWGMQTVATAWVEVNGTRYPDASTAGTTMFTMLCDSAAHDKDDLFFVLLPLILARNTAYTVTVPTTWGTGTIRGMWAKLDITISTQALLNSLLKWELVYDI